MASQEGFAFPDKEEGDVLGAGHINNLNKVAWDYVGQNPGSFQFGKRGGTTASPVPFTQRLMIVSKVSFEPSDDDDESDESSWSSSSSASHSNSNSNSESDSSSSELQKRKRYYEAYPRYYSHEAKAWFTDVDDGPHELDTSEFDGYLVVGDVVIAYWDTQRQSYIAQPNRRVPSSIGTGGSGSGGGSTTTNTCCCDESNCLPEIPGVATKPKPDYRAFPYISVCNCTGGGTSPDGNGGTIRLYRATEGNDDVWEQKHGAGDNLMKCRYPDCSSTSRWEWNGSDWDVISNSNPSCGTPPKPDYSGTKVGQSASTDYIPPSYTSYWRETHLAKDANGCDQSKLELIIEDGN